ncbi:MAG: multiheme c-type cytochrome, partial [Planctomycetota bacterium]
MATTILTTGQRRLMAVLSVLAGFMLANAAYLWLSPPGESLLPSFYQWMLVIHVVVGTLILAPMVWFVVWHMKRALAMGNPRAIWSGIGVAVAAFALLVTGLFITSEANSAANAWAFVSHQVLAVLAPLGYAVHRLVARHRPERNSVVWGVGAPAVLLAGMLAYHHATLPEEPPRPQHFVEPPPEGVDPFREYWPEEGPGGAPEDSVFHPASTRSATGGFLDERLISNADLPDPDVLAKDLEEFGFAVNARIGSASCEGCHPDTTEQWARSAHRFASFNNPFYRASIEAFREAEDGKRRSQWCAGCHDPAIMMAGNWMKDVEPTIPESQAGLTCMACHAMDAVHGLGGNGNYRIADDQPDPYLFPGAKSGVLKDVHDLLIRSKPGVHKRSLMKPVFQTPEYCAVCHKVSLDAPVNRYRWLRGQDEYDNHQDSGVSRNNARTFYLPPKA